jgi:hypothetical protein
MDVSSEINTPSPSFWSKHWKPIVAVGCLGVFFIVFIFILMIAGFWLYRNSRSAETPTTVASEKSKPKARIEKRASILDQPTPRFLRSKGGYRPPASSVTQAPAEVRPVVLTAVDARSAEVEVRFMNALLAGDMNSASALTGARLQASGGLASLRLFAALTADHGGGSFVPKKAARLPDGATATIGRISFKDGTSVKVTLLSIDGKVDGFTSGP